MALFYRNGAENEQDLEQTTGGGFQRPKPEGFLRKQFRKGVEKARTEITEKMQFNRDVREAKKEAFKEEKIKLAKDKVKQRFKQARQQGKTKARKGSFGFSLGEGLKKAPGEKPQKSNMEKLLGL